MTEAEWPACGDPERMLREVTHALSGGEPGPPLRARKRDLFRVACARLVWHLLTDDDVKQAIEWAEATAGKGYEEDHEAWTEHSRSIKFATDSSGTDEQIMAPYVVEAAWIGEFDTAVFHLIRHFPDGLPNDTPGRLASLIRDIVGNPFRPVTADPAWLTSTVVDLARGVYDDRAFDRLPILADALQDAGCDNDDVLTHLRGPGPHARGCWVVDLVLGKS